MISVYDLYLGENRIPYLQKVDEIELDKSTEFCNTPGKVVELINDIFHADRQAEEHVYEVALNARMVPQAVFAVNHGSVSEAYANTAGILQRCLLSGGMSFILLHNHPSGHCKESRDDVTMTQKLQEAAKICGLQLCDHIIIGGSQYRSLKEQGIIT